MTSVLAIPNYKMVEDYFCSHTNNVDFELRTEMGVKKQSSNSLIKEIEITGLLEATELMVHVGHTLFNRDMNFKKK